MNNNAIQIVKSILYILVVCASAIAGYVSAITSLNIRLQYQENRITIIEKTLDENLKEINKQLSQIQIQIARIEEKIKKEDVKEK